jgi:beta-mannosidase
MVVEKISLDGTWTLQNEDGSFSLDAQVPGSVFEALIEEDMIVDPFYGENERIVSWVYESSWSFERVFEVPEGFLQHEHVLLRCHGLDTVATVQVNGTMVGSAANMFMVHEFDIKHVLVAGSNTITIVFTSPTKAAMDETRKHHLRLGGLVGGAIPGVPYLRKDQRSFGWDWGPRLPDIGIWKSIEVVGHDGATIESVQVLQAFDYSSNPSDVKDPGELTDLRIVRATLEVNVEVGEATAKSGLDVSVALAGPSELDEVQRVTATESTVMCTFTVDDPAMWWTHDLGEQPLYAITVSIIDSDAVVDTSVHAVGIRDIQLVRTPDRWGETFYFRLNGIPVFAKGADWVPVDSFITRGRRLGLYERLLQDAKRANMNAIRVWGGGIYEDDAFYDLCDRFGILVWQDFPFACAIYPPWQEFVDVVRSEAIQNVKRLRNHASLAIWCGNNEDEQLKSVYLTHQLLGKPWLRKSFDQGYLYMFEEMLPSIVADLDPKRPYWPSSPSKGIGSKERGLLKSNLPDRGDSHFWKVWHMSAPFAEYRDFDSRFMSEYGFESFPEMKTIRAFTAPEDYDFFSPVMKNHQKNSAGNGKIMKYMKRRFAIPPAFVQQVMLSQITQAEAIEYGIEHWRRNRNDFHCMGSLYWQLNDCWPVASWSSIDYYGRWKALHYVAARAYRPFVASAREERDKVEFWVVNDGRSPRAGKLEWRIADAEGKVLLSGAKVESVPPCSAALVDTADTAAINKDPKAMAGHVIFFSLAAEDGSILHHGFRLFGDPKDFPIANPHLEVTGSLEDVGDGSIQYELNITASSIALYVYLDSETVDFLASDNFFSLDAGETRTIVVEPVTLPLGDEAPAGQAFLDAISAKSLFDLVKK